MKKHFSAVAFARPLEPCYDKFAKQQQQQPQQSATITAAARHSKHTAEKLKRTYYMQPTTIYVQQSTITQTCYSSIRFETERNDMKQSSSTYVVFIQFITEHCANQTRNIFKCGVIFQNSNNKNDDDDNDWRNNIVLLVRHTENFK